MDTRNRAGPDPNRERHRLLRRGSVYRDNSTEARSESGFTLIELLVVIIIIGILAAIAIPTFLAQRVRAFDAAAQSDLRSLAGAEEQYLTENQTYATIAALQLDSIQVRASNDVTVTVVLFDAMNSYCLSAVHASSGQVYYYDSAASGIQPKGSAGCPTTTTGTAGDSLTG